MKTNILQYLYNVIVPEGDDGLNAFSDVLTYLKDLLDRKEISSYSISPVVKTMTQFNNRRYFSRILNISVNGELEAVSIDFHLLGVVYTLGTLDSDEGIQRSLDDFCNKIRDVVTKEMLLESFNQHLVFYTLYKEIVGD